MIERKTSASKQQIITEYLNGTDTFKTLSLKYGVNKHTIQTWVRAFRLNCPKQVTSSTEPDDIKKLKKQLEDAKLKIELLEEMLRLSEEQTGLDLRKKYGTRQS
jgi:transposase-like protein